MTFFTTPLQPSASDDDAIPGDSRYPKHYDTALGDVSALTPLHASRGRAGPNLGDTTHLSFWRESLVLVERHLTFDRRKVQCGDYAYQCGHPFDSLYLVSSGIFKIINLAASGREQATGLYFKGDWMGFDGIPSGTHSCSAMALDIGEVWAIPYDALLKASAKEPILMRLLIAAMSAKLSHHRNEALTMGNLSADARVADFLLQWALCLAARGMRTDQIHVNMSRADIGDYLGLRLETVSRALSTLSRYGLIHFQEKRRRDIGIPHMDALRAFIQNGTHADPCG